MAKYGGLQRKDWERLGVTGRRRQAKSGWLQRKYYLKAWLSWWGLAA